MQPFHIFHPLALMSLHVLQIQLVHSERNQNLEWCRLQSPLLLVMAEIELSLHPLPAPLLLLLLLLLLRELLPLEGTPAPHLHNQDACLQAPQPPT
jgi:hypothetical protein